MKKLIVSTLVCIFAALSLCACATSRDPVPERVAETREPVRIEHPIVLPEPEPEPEPDEPDGDYYVPPIPGVRRHVHPTLFGSYAVEYVHTPYHVQKDDTLDVTLELRQDNTYDMSVTVSGVKSSHYGHWYEKNSGITLYFDEPIDPPAHNEYVSDCAYIEVLPHGKMRLYEGGSTIILSKVPSADTARTFA